MGKFCKSFELIDMFTREQPEPGVKKDAEVKKVADVNKDAVWKTWRWIFPNKAEGKSNSSATTKSKSVSIRFIIDK